MSKFFNRLPSVSDLLEAAPLKGLLERVGTHRVVAETTQFLDRMRHEAQSVAQQAFSASPQELASRVARWIMSGPRSSPRTLINATGILFDYEPPLSMAAIDAMSAASEYQASEGYRAAIDAAVQRSTSAPAALVLTNASAAMVCTFAALAGGKPILLRRGELERGPAESTLAELATSLGLAIREVGSANETRASDYETELSSGMGLLLSIAPRWTSFGNTIQPGLADLASLAHRFHTPLVADIGWGTFVSSSSVDGRCWPTATEAVATGADLVLVRGSGLLGGPACGILLGRRELIDRIAAHPLTRCSLASTSVLAALAATLEQSENTELAEQNIPVRVLLATAVENLKLRAERLAPQIMATGNVASAEAFEISGHLSSRRASADEIPSWAIAVTPKSGSPEMLSQRLLASPQSLAVAIDGGRVLVNLCTVAPRHDISIVDTFAGLSPASAPSPNSSLTAEDSSPEAVASEASPS